MATNIFVLGLDDMNAELLHALPHAEQYSFHRLLDLDDLLTDDIRLPELLASAERQLYRFDGSIDAIIGYWDFPVSSLVPILCERFHTTGPSLEAVVKCEHKYWSRLVQQEVVAAHPRFALLDTDHRGGPPSGLTYPLWVKPVKSVSSALAFRATNHEEFRAGLEAIRQNIDWMGAPFQYVLERIHAPPEIGPSDHCCLVEEDATGVQLTVEGYTQHGEAHVYGVVETINYPGTFSFLRYLYPARVPDHVIDRLTDIATRVISHVGLNNSTWNIEFFWDRERDSLSILEINPRHSQSHARLFQMVDGVANHHALVSIALGLDPELPTGQGPAGVAAKCFLREFGGDAQVVRVPTAVEVARVERDVPLTKVDVVAREGERLSNLTHQDSYSYELALIYIGAEIEDELDEKYHTCVERLPFGLQRE
ncbi:ATP-grasp domain-containing protein [Phytoactinopolyspora mesophila]|uniref:ATP-grasp domain-containing protein n=1 Tax=Phytoactinopolyspora mesophila TaxID=2650750 RepID=A0A7K3MBN5_9ACTN|nr:ATP-grasp domain-containing protein [Phytoactinopolyspora mesophila]NDL60729.1 ATP-grasp domain-containing protein [Phytoactinopolyspora mesophila]